jgi:hypothetical protein
MPLSFSGESSERGFWLLGCLAYIGGMITIAQIAEVIEAARRYCLPGREAAMVNSLMFQLRRELNDEQQIFHQ